MSQKLLVVMGATGAQGGSVLTSFLSDPTWRIRALTRDPSSPSALSLRSSLSSTYPNAKENLEFVRASFSDLSSLRAAFANATAVFAMTDFWSILSSLSTSQITESKKLPNQLAHSLEIEYAKNIFRAAAEVGGDTLEKFIWSGLPYNSKRTGGKYTQSYHFDSKAIATEWLFENLPGLAAKTSVVSVGLYAENHANRDLKEMFGMRKDTNGCFVLRLAIPPAIPLPYIIASEQTGYFVKALITSPSISFEKIALRAFSASISPTDFMALWGRVLGVPARYEEITVDEIAEKAGGLMKGQMRDTMGAFRDFGYWGGEGDESIRPDEVGIEMPGVEALEDWIKRTDWSAIVGK